MTKELPNPEWWDINRPIPYENNAKIHTEGEIEKLAKSIINYGWTQPIVVDGDDVIIAGHGRLLAAQLIEAEQVPVVQRADLTKEQAKALRLIDNRVVGLEYDVEKISEDLRDIFASSEEGVIDDIKGIYDEKEIEMLVEDTHEDIDLDAFDDDGLFDEDTSGDIAAADDEEVLVSKALGFKMIPVRAFRDISQMMSEIERITELTGAAALEAYSKYLVTNTAVREGQVEEV